MNTTAPIVEPYEIPMMVQVLRGKSHRPALEGPFDSC